MVDISIVIQTKVAKVVYYTPPFIDKYQTFEEYIPLSLQAFEESVVISILD